LKCSECDLKPLLALPVMNEACEIMVFRESTNANSLVGIFVLPLLRSSRT
jgi:hypothetical protein